MTHTKNKTIKEAYNRYLKSDICFLWECYGHCSRAKENAFEYCRGLVGKYNGGRGAIIGYNTNTFSYGFIGYIDNREAFFYITKDYDRYIFIDEI